MIEKKSIRNKIQGEAIVKTTKGRLLRIVKDETTPIAKTRPNIIKSFG